MEKTEEMEWDVFETVIAWYASIQDDTEINPDDVDDFLRRLGVAVTNPIFHLEVSGGTEGTNYKKLTGFLDEDIKVLELLMKSYNWISKGALPAEVRKYINYLENYKSKILAGEIEGLKEMEKTIKEVSEEYSVIINDLKLY